MFWDTDFLPVERAPVIDDDEIIILVDFFITTRKGSDKNKV